MYLSRIYSNIKALDKLYPVLFNAGTGFN